MISVRYVADPVNRKNTYQDYHYSSVERVSKALSEAHSFRAYKSTIIGARNSSSCKECLSNRSRAITFLGFCATPNVWNLNWKRK